MLREIKRIKTGTARSLFECFCGNTFVTCRYNVTGGHTKSCGCITRNKCRSKAPTYRTWINMMSRATKPYYPHHNGRGIGMTSRWRSYDTFLADMGPIPEGMSLDRINNDGDYCKENCRWADQKTQMRNNSQNRVLEYKGEKKTVTEWAELAGVKPNTLEYRILRGWPVEKAIETPTNCKNK